MVLVLALAQEEAVVEYLEEECWEHQSAEPEQEIQRLSTVEVNWVIRLIQLQLVGKQLQLSWVLTQIWCYAPKQVHRD